MFSIMVMIASLRNSVGVYIHVVRMRLSSWLVIVLQGGYCDICVGGWMHRYKLSRRSLDMGVWKGCVIRRVGVRG